MRDVHERMEDDVTPGGQGRREPLADRAVQLLSDLVEGVLDGVAEVLVGLLACALLAGAVAAVVAGWRADPFVTAVTVAALAGFVGHGVRTLASGRPARTRSARLAVGAAAAVAAWLAVVASSCRCLA